MTDQKESICFEIPDFSEILGCFSSEGRPNDVHFGGLIQGLTACGRPMGDAILGGQIEVNCPDCISEFKYREAHPEAAREKIGIVTHKIGK